MSEHHQQQQQQPRRSDQHQPDPEPGPSNDVRPPIAPVRQILNPNPIGYTPEATQRRYNTRTGPVSDVYDAFRDFQAEAQWQEMAQEGTDPVNNAETTNNVNRRQTLQELFRPPLDLMFRGSLASARETGSLQDKWLLVNIQNGREFACQILNRDVWSNQTVKDIIKEHFIFWQVYHDSYEGQRYVQFYHVSKFPHVAIIDPRTGELMKSWPTTIDHNYFCDSVIEYLTEHPSPDGGSEAASTMKKIRVKKEEDELAPKITTLYDQSEEAQLEAAIKASLQESEKVNTYNDDTIEIDDDTVEAIDMFDQQQIARDRELIERSPPRELKKTCEQIVTNVSKQQSHSESSVSVDNNSHHEKNDKSTADTLSAAAAKSSIKIEGPECKIALRFPDGSSLVQRFSAREQLAAVRSFVQMEKSAISASNLEFVVPPNRKLTESMMNETLESLGLCPASRLVVNCVQD